ncbi:predicted protein [Sclerotinia sclerotiorum 1980 UF-70]|uniref:Uncharacterized protein n=1 Tax=Sclerotinia sclerotiorum (strain ATCC 18683 / 1980 / Ss-1) TaxID=665079 RepID=A7EPP7_SCLS1|nr:predicted protein [Sclerotinia sclerotiorum 1980 UF-70]EDO04813.1 predicted protein [Sclerotinia sclerotiorum 1980 UF-70]
MCIKSVVFSLLPLEGHSIPSASAVWINPTPFLDSVPLKATGKCIKRIFDSKIPDSKVEDMTPWDMSKIVLEARSPMHESSKTISISTTGYLISSSTYLRTKIYPKSRHPTLRAETLSYLYESSVASTSCIYILAITKAKRANISEI